MLNNEIEQQGNGDDHPKVFVFSKDEINSLIEQSLYRPWNDFFYDALRDKKLSDGVIKYSIDEKLPESLKELIRKQFGEVARLLNFSVEETDSKAEVRVTDFSWSEYLFRKDLNGSTPPYGEAIGESKFKLNVNAYKNDSEDLFGLPKRDAEFSSTINHEFFHLLGIYGHVDDEKAAPLLAEIGSAFHSSAMLTVASRYPDAEIGVLDIFSLEKELDLQTNYIDYFNAEANYPQYQVTNENGLNIININLDVNNYTRDISIIEMPRNGDIAIITATGEVVVPEVLTDKYDGVRFRFTYGASIVDNSLYSELPYNMYTIVESDLILKNNNQLTADDVALSVCSAVDKGYNVPEFVNKLDVQQMRAYSPEMFAHQFLYNYSTAQIPLQDVSEVSYFDHQTDTTAKLTSWEFGGSTRNRV